MCESEPGRRGLAPPIPSRTGRQVFKIRSPPSRGLPKLRSSKRKKFAGFGTNEQQEPSKEHDGKKKS